MGDHSDAMISARRTIAPHNNDVLLGRGGNNNKHVGNAQLRSLARAHVVSYSRASKKDKSKISREMVNLVRSMNPAGRFLKRHQFSEQWEDVGDDVAREKASQALRDAVSQKDAGDDDLDQELLANSSHSQASVAGTADLSSQILSSTDMQNNSMSSMQNNSMPSMQNNSMQNSSMQNPFAANITGERIQAGMHSMNPPASTLPVNMMSSLNHMGMNQLPNSSHSVSRLQQMQQMQQMQQLQQQIQMEWTNLNLNSGFPGMSVMNQQHTAMNFRYPTTTLNENSTELPPVPLSNNLDNSMMDSSEASVTSVSSSTSNRSRYKYYGNFRAKVPQLNTQMNRTVSSTSSENKRPRSMPGMTPMPTGSNNNPSILPTFSSSNDAAVPKTRDRYSAAENSARLQSTQSSLPSLYQHIEDRIRYRNENQPARVRQHVHSVHFNDRSSIGRSSIGRSSIGKSSMGGVETISNFSSRMASEAGDLDLANFDWVRNAEVASVRTDMSWNSYDS